MLLSSMLLSVVIHDLDLGRVAVRPPEDHPPLVVDPDRMEAFKTSSQFLQMVRRRYRKIASSGRVHKDVRAALQFGVDAARGFELEGAGSAPVMVGQSMPWHAKRSRVRPAFSAPSAIAWRNSCQPDRCWAVEVPVGAKSCRGPFDCCCATEKLPIARENQTDIYVGRPPFF